MVTFGLAFPWTLMRTYKMYFRNALVPNNFDWDALQQTENEFGGATGDEMADMFDFDFGI